MNKETLKTLTSIFDFLTEKLLILKERLCECKDFENHKKNDISKEINRIQKFKINLNEEIKNLIKNIEIKEKIFQYLDKLSDESRKIFKNEVNKLKNINIEIGIEANQEITDIIYIITDNTILLSINNDNKYGTEVFRSYGRDSSFIFTNLDINSFPDFFRGIYEYNFANKKEYEYALDEAEDEKNEYIACKRDFITIFNILAIYFGIDLPQ